MVFPPSVMAISILEELVPDMTEDTGDWIWRFPICCGCLKSAPADRCYRCANDALTLLTRHKDNVVSGIEERFGETPVSGMEIYLQWHSALTIITTVSAQITGDCHWSAPTDRSDPFQSVEDCDKFIAQLWKSHAEGTRDSAD
jgi:hypothetical protein